MAATGLVLAWAAPAHLPSRPLLRSMASAVPSIGVWGLPADPPPLDIRPVLRRLRQSSPPPAVYTAGGPDPSWGGPDPLSGGPDLGLSGPRAGSDRAAGSEVRGCCRGGGEMGGGGSRGGLSRSLSGGTDTRHPRGWLLRASAGSGVPRCVQSSSDVGAGRGVGLERRLCASGDWWRRHGRPIKGTPGADPPPLLPVRARETSFTAVAKFGLLGAGAAAASSSFPCDIAGDVSSDLWTSFAP
jgi:hypothetical protein